MRTGWKFQNLRVISALALPLVMASACQLDDMANTTTRMGSTTDRMANTTDHMSSTTEQMSATTQKLLELTQKLKELTDHMYTDLRQGNSLTIRSERLEAMEKAETPEAKVDEAGQYFMAFEFQLMKDEELQIQDLKDSLDYYAMLQFFRDLSRYMRASELTRDIDVQVLSKEPKERSEADERLLHVLAMSVAMHKTNPNSEIYADRAGRPRVSMQSLFKDTLRKKFDIETGKIKRENVKKFEQEILTTTHEKMVVQLFQARANFLPMMTLSKLTDVEDRGLLGLGKALYFGWDASFDRASISGLRECIEWIHEATRTVNFLKELNYPVRIDSNVLGLYKSLKLPEAGKGAEDLKLNEADRKARVDTEEELLAELHAFRAAIGGE